MAVTGAIPLPKPNDFGEQSMFDSIMRNKYQKSQIDLAQQQEARNREMMPYIMQKYKDEQMKAQRENDIYNQFFGGGAQQQEPSQQTPGISQTDQAQMNAMRPGDSYVVGSGQRPTQGVPQNSMQGMPTPGQGMPTVAPQPMQDNAASDQIGGEKVIKAGDPRKSVWDKFAGMTVPGTSIRIPDIKTKIQNGMQYDTYPSGKVVATKVGNTDEEKAEIGLNAAEQKEQKKADIKAKKEDDDFFSHLSQYADNNEAIARIFNRNPSVTGLLPWAKKKFKMGDKDYAAVNRLAAPMVGDLAQELSKKGSVFALQMAKEGKYDPTQPADYNQGILEQNNDAIVRDYNRRAAVYRERFGKEPPYKLPQYYRDWEKRQKTQEMLDKQNGNTPSQSQEAQSNPQNSGSNIENGKVTIIDSTGQEHVIDRDKIAMAKQRDPGTQVKKGAFQCSQDLIFLI